MTQQHSSRSNSTLAFRATAIAAALVAGAAGCSVAPSGTARGAGIGAGAGALTGVVATETLGVNPGTAILGGALAGAAVGGVIGMIADANERKEQDNLAVERAYMQATAARRAEQARQQSLLQEELEISQGFKISELELNDARQKVENSDAELKSLMEERANARARKKELDDLEQKQLDNIAKIEELRAELARLKGDLTPTGPVPASMPTPENTSPSAQSSSAPSAAPTASGSASAVRPNL